LNILAVSTNTAATIRDVLRAIRLLETDEISLTTYVCDGAGHGWSHEEPVEDHAVVLVRSGVFRRRVDGVEVVADPMTGYIEWPGSTHQVAHPCGGDVCTVISLSSRAVGSLLDTEQRPLFVGPAVDLAHRSLLRSIREAGDMAELIEQTTVLAGQLLDHETAPHPRLTRRQFRLVDRARLALNEDPHLNLAELARSNGTSMYHLSRTFRAAMGMTLSRYRLRLRARLAMDRIANGERRLARLAAEVGFADQAHMTRTLRRETDLTPGRLRDRL
jgi:AraC-like DNA-binding protein